MSHATRKQAKADAAAAKKAKRAQRAAEFDKMMKDSKARRAAALAAHRADPEHNPKPSIFSTHAVLYSITTLVIVGVVAFVIYAVANPSKSTSGDGCLHTYYAHASKTLLKTVDGVPVYGPKDHKLSIFEDPNDYRANGWTITDVVEHPEYCK